MWDPARNYWRKDPDRSAAYHFTAAEVSLPSLQMRMTDKVPAAQRARAQLTLRRLKLRDGEKIVRWRQRWYGKYQAGKLTLDGLRDFAPLIADAVEREQRANARKPARAATKRKNSTRRPSKKR